MTHDDPFGDVPFPEAPPEFGEPHGGAWAETAASDASTIKAAKFDWITPSRLPVREWLLGRHIIRKFVSTTVAPGGVGKSSLEIAEALSLASGRALIGHMPHGQFKVWYVNLEDPMDELQRRFMATAMHYGLEPADIRGRLFVNSGRDMRMIVAEQTRAGVTIVRPVVDAIRNTILAHQIDVVIIDPFVSSHAISENDNMAVNAVATVWAEIADYAGCGIELVHHARKTGGNEVTMEDARGAVALLAKARAGRVLNVMSKEEAERFGIEDSRRTYFRVDSGKGNLAAPSTDASSWFKMVSVPLGNGPLGTEGDSVGVVTEWTKPDPFAGITADDLRKAQAAVRTDGPWRQNPQAKQWVGKPIARALGLDPDDKAHKTKIARLLKVWIENDMFVLVEGPDENRKLRTFVEVGKPASDHED